MTTETRIREVARIAAGVLRYAHYGPVVGKIDATGIVEEAPKRKRGRPRKQPAPFIEPADDLGPTPLDEVRTGPNGHAVCDRLSGFVLLRCGPGMSGGSRGCGAGVAVPLGCGKRDCPGCRRTVAGKRARRLEASIGGPDLGVLTVTLPPSWQKHLNRRRIRLIENAVWSSYLVTVGSQSIAKAGCRAYWHPCGDVCRSCGVDSSAEPSSIGDLGRCPDCDEPGDAHPHLNLLIPLMGVTVGGQLRPIRRLLDVDAMRLRLQSALDSTAELLDLETEPVQFWYGFRVEDAQKRHSFQYFARPFPGWQDALTTTYSHGRQMGLCADTRSQAAQLWRPMVKPAASPDPLSLAECPCCGMTGTLVVERAYYGAISIKGDGFGGILLEIQARDDIWLRYSIAADIAVGIADT